MGLLQPYGGYRRGDGQADLNAGLNDYKGRPLRGAFFALQAMHHTHRGNLRRRVVSAINQAYLNPVPGNAAGEYPRVGKEKTMTNFIKQIKEAAEKRALYVRTRDEIARMPDDMARDLNIWPGDAEEIANMAVYGRA